MGNLSSSGTSLNINSIYKDYSPAFDNLYTIEILPIKSESTVFPITDYIKFHATNVTFNGESLNLERNEVTKNFQLSGDGYTRTDILSITWRESDTWKVKKYHDNWLSYFYDKKEDCFLSYPRQDGERDYLENDVLYREFKITLPSFSNESSEVITFEYVLPKSSAGLSLGWKSNGDIVSHSLEYYITDWKQETIKDKEWLD